MPLRDHFDPPTGRRPNWDRVHGGWPMVVAQYLYRKLPSRYHVAPQVHLGHHFEVDVGTYDTDADNFDGSFSESANGGVATALWSPPEPTLKLEAEPLDPDEYEVRIFDAEDGQRLVAVIEFVSPANKDRPETRQAFLAKCASLLQQDVCLSIVDLVTTRQFNLYVELLELLDRNDPMMGSNPPPLYAVTVHRRNGHPRWRLNNWAHILHVGQPLPSLPIWLNDREGTMLDLEATYEETCQTLRIV